jgi:hypothetical protein
MSSVSVKKVPTDSGQDLGALWWDRRLTPSSQVLYTEDCSGMMGDSESIVDHIIAIWVCLLTIAN